jgi:hypothetical protein
MDGVYSNTLHSHSKSTMVDDWKLKEDEGRIGQAGSLLQNNCAAT